MKNTYKVETCMMNTTEGMIEADFFKVQDGDLLFYNLLRIAPYDDYVVGFAAGHWTKVSKMEDE